nr:histone acetyltransferase type B catalytic subunit [Tanacetum cinerariifolium]
MGTKNQSNDTVSDSKKRRKVGFTQPDEGVQPNDVIKIFI